MKKYWNILLVILALVFIFFFGTMLSILAIPLWIYLVVMISRKRLKIFQDRIRTDKAEKRLQRIKKLLTAAAILFIVAIIGIVLHNIPMGFSEDVMFISFFVGVITLYAFVAVTAWSAYLFFVANSGDQSDWNKRAHTH